MNTRPETQFGFSFIAVYEKDTLVMCDSKLTSYLALVHFLGAYTHIIRCWVFFLLLLLLLTTRLERKIKYISRQQLTLVS